MSAIVDIVLKSNSLSSSHTPSISIEILSTCVIWVQVGDYPFIYLVNNYMIQLFILHDVGKQLILISDWFNLIIRLSLSSGFPLIKIKFISI